MEDHFAEFMKVLDIEGKAYKPFLADTLRLLEETKKAATEKKPTGGATSKARQARQRLRNAVLGTAHNGTAKSVAAVLVKKTGQDFGKAFEQVFRAYALHQQARLEYELYEGAAPSDYKSREQSPLDERPDVVHFVENVGEHGAAPYMLGRIGAYMNAFIAWCVVDANEDPRFKRPDNQWPLLKQAGFLDAYDGHLSDDEDRLLAAVAAVRDDPEALALWERFNQGFAELDVTVGFKATCQRLLDQANCLRDGEAQAMFDARGRRRLAQTEIMGKLLNLPADELTKVDAFVRILEDPMWTIDGGAADLNRRLIVNLLLLHFNDCDERDVHPSEWLPSITATLLNKDGFIARNVSSEAAFWSLTFAALELSTFRGREEVRLLRQRETADQATRDALAEFYHRHGMAHHTDNDGVPWLGEAVAEDEFSNDANDRRGEEGQSAAGYPQPATAAGMIDGIIDAEFVAYDEDPTAGSSALEEAPPIDERNGGFRSSTNQNRFEEFE